MPEEKGALDEFERDFSSGEEAPKKDDDFLNPDEGNSEGEDADGASEGKQEVEPRKNRHHRRIEAKLNAEREANIHLNARLEALTEAAQFAKETGGLTVDQRLLQLYGDDENGRRAAQLTQSLLQDAAEKGEARAIERLREEQRKEAAEVKREEEFIDESLEELEEDSGVDLTSNSPEGRKNRTQFLNLVDRLSSKDGDGNIKDYADFDEVFDVFQKTRSKPDSSRQKDIASRGQVRSGNSSVRAGDTAGENYLKQHGII